MAKVSTKGYKKNSKDKAEPSLRIPSSIITMKEDDGTPLKKGPILGIDNLGNQQMMLPGMDYQFPGNYVDEIPMAKRGGTKKVKIDSLPKAQNGEEVTPEYSFVPPDADRYGMNKFILKGDDTQYVDPALFQQVQDLQNRINPLAQSSSSSRKEYERRVLEAINRVEPQNYDVTTSGYIPESVRQSEDVRRNGLNGCISGVCYTLNEAGEPVRYYSNSMFQDAIKAGTEKDWELDFDTKNISGGDIVQFTGEREGPHHGALVVPNSVVNNEDGTITFEAFMNSGTGPMYRKTYTLDPKEDRVDNFSNETIQLIKRKSPSDLDNLVAQRDQLKNQIEAADPSAFKKGRARRWNTYMPGAFTEVGVDYSRFDGLDPERLVAGSMMQNLKLEDAARLLRQSTISTPKPIDGINIKFDSKYDIDYDALRKTGGFENILNQINDPEFKMNFMKDMNITNREYNALVLNSFGLYGQESGFGTKTGGIEETDVARKADSVAEDIWSRVTGKGAFRRDVDEDYSRGLTQVKLRNIKGQDRRQYGIDKESVEDDPTKAFTAAMIVNAQNLPELRKLADKGETDALNMSNYLDFIPYMYNQPNRLRRGDRKTIERALAEGEDPAQALVIDPNSPMANNEYVKNVRTYSDLLKFMPLAIDTVPKKFGGPLYKAQDGFNFSFDPSKSFAENTELNKRAQIMGWNSVAEYEKSGWGQNEVALKQRALINNPQVQQMAKTAAEMNPELANVQARQDQLYANKTSNTQKAVNQAYYTLSNPLDALGQYSKYGYIPQGNVGNYGYKDDSAGPVSLANTTFNPFAWGNAAYRFANEVGNADSWTTGRGAVNMTTDFLEALPLFSEASKAAEPALKYMGEGLNTAAKYPGQLYNNVATGNSFIPYAWKSPAVGLSQEKSAEMFKGLLNSGKLTPAENALIIEYQSNSRPFTGRSTVGANVLNTEKRAALNDIIKKYNLDVNSDAILTRRFNFDRGTLGTGIENGRMNFGDRPTSFSAGVGTEGYSGAPDRLVIPNRYVKNMGNNLLANPYGKVSDETLSFLEGSAKDFALNAPSLNEAIIGERELIGTGLDFKQIGKVKNDIGGFDYVVKPKNIKGGTNINSGDKTFKSEIDWAKWNPETPNHPELINEYNAIEQNTKMSGDWLKRIDGKKWKPSAEAKKMGLVEQEYIMQSSDRFKKAYPEGFETTYRGQNTGTEVMGGGDRGYDPRIVFTGDKDVALSYAQTPFNGKKHSGELFMPGISDPSQPAFYKLMYPKTSKSKTLTARNGDWRFIKDAELQKLLIPILQILLVLTILPST